MCSQIGKLNYNRLLFAALVLVPLMQVSSLWNYSGEKVDESEIYMYAVGFFGGDYNPHWYGYGNLPMYALHAVYLVLFPLVYLVGSVGSFAEYCQQAFHNGFFVLVARYVFAVVGVATVLIYAQAGRERGMSGLMVGAFLLVGFLGKDSLTFANYIRCDVFVAFFCAVAFYCALKSNQRKYLYLLAIAVAGCIASKKSALPLLAYLAAFTGYQWWRGHATWRDVVGVLLLFAGASFVFQPYVNWVEQVASLVAIGSEGVTFSFSKTQYGSVDARFHAILNVLTSYCSPYVLGLVPLSLFAWRQPRLLFATYFLLFLLLAPYLVSNEITYYWFAPVFPLVNFLAIFGVSTASDVLVAHFQKREMAFAAHALPAVVGLLSVAFVTYFVGWPNARSLVKAYTAEPTNSIKAQKWLCENISLNDIVLFEAQNSFMIPKLYDINHSLDSKMISRGFLYNRDRNQFLKDMFLDYLRNTYIKERGVFNVRSVHMSRAHILEQVGHEEFKRVFYVVSPQAIQPFRKTSNEEALSPAKLELKSRYRSYFNAMTSGKLVQRFTGGHSYPVEVYDLSAVVRAHQVGGKLFSRAGHERWLYRHDPNEKQRLWIQAIDHETKAGEKVEASLTLSSDQAMVVSASLARHNTAEPYEGSAKTVILEPGEEVEVNLTHVFEKERDKLKIQLDVRECDAPTAHLTVKDAKLFSAGVTPEHPFPVKAR